MKDVFGQDVHEAALVEAALEKVEELQKAKEAEASQTEEKVHLQVAKAKISPDKWFFAKIKELAWRRKSQ